MAVRHIYETAQTEAEVKRRLRELIEYIKWKQGWQTIEAYEHYFDAARHAEIQDMIHQKMDEVLKKSLQEYQMSGPAKGAGDTHTRGTARVVNADWFTDLPGFW